MTFAAFCLLSVIRKQYLKQWKFSVNQLALLTGCGADFAWFYQTPYYLDIFRLICTLRDIWILPINSTICEGLVAIAWAVFKILKGSYGASPPPPQVAGIGLILYFVHFLASRPEMTWWLFFRLLDFQVAFDKRLDSWKNENDKLTRDACTSLLKLLKKEHLGPVLEKLHGGEGAQVSFEDIIQGYNRLEQDFKVRATGAKDVSAAVFFNFIR